jgi:glycosyltransferase involved in cell wall biosynthesis
VNPAEHKIAPHKRKPVVLATVPYYLPGFKGGGKLFSVRNLVAGLRDRFRFKVMTADRDLGDARRYPGIDANQWTSCGGCEVFYAGARPDSIGAIGRQLGESDYDVLHLNSIFSPRFGIAPLMLRRFGCIARKPTIVAPRGELAPSALSIKSPRKKLFLVMARKFGWLEGVSWQASSESEAEDIRRMFGMGASITVAPDLLKPEYPSWPPSRYRKRPGHLDMVFFSRIAPVKNLHLAIETLRGIGGHINFRIAGPIDDSVYWARCQKSIATLNTNIRIEYLGPVPASQVANYLARHGLLLLPSASESFGYAILEAMLTGCPVLIGDRTPWRNLARLGVGWDLPLTRLDRMREVLQEAVAMDDAAHRQMSRRAREFALDYLARDDSADRNAAMFHAMMDT